MKKDEVSNATTYGVMVFIGLLFYGCHSLYDPEGDHCGESGWVETANGKVWSDRLYQICDSQGE